MDTNQKKAEIIEKIQQRNLSQWHLLVASILGSLATQGGMFNQAYLNRLLKRSMIDFVLPYFETLPEYSKTLESVANSAELLQKMKNVVQFVDGVFPLAQDLSVESVDEKSVRVRIVGETCRLCPKGIGKADIEAGQTFCPFPTMLEETAKFFFGEDKIKLVFKREGAKTKVLEKVDGVCFIEYQAA